ncbi:CheR family methyltransferase, partial [candidate division KSB1 bacterium]
IERRMIVHQIDRIQNYVKYIENNIKELDILFKELLIGVTNFFRDPEAFAELGQKVIPELFKGKPQYYTFRVWVTGCSTGEEAYSIAILFKELIEKNSRNYSAQIFATDLDNSVIDIARNGVFPSGITTDVSEEYLNRYFIKEDSGYRIRKDIRDMIVFAKQDLIKDPPFSKLDMVCCRNLLIYLGTEIQRKILPLFHYTLVNDGVLFLGSSETIGQFIDLFSVVDKKWKIFRKKGDIHSSRPAPEFPIVSHSEEITLMNENGFPGKRVITDLRKLSENLLLNEFSPSCVVINYKYEILHFYGRTGSYLEPPPGDPQVNILEMAREGLKMPLNTAIQKSISSKKEVVCREVEVLFNGGHIVLNLILKPVNISDSDENLIIIVFEEVKRYDESKKKKDKKSGKTDKEYLQTIIEELETSNEELKSTNEELQSSNEELQSTNEELMTSKEELQSVNEELMTVNSELENKINELRQTNNDMNNLLSSTEIATIFLDTDLNIVRYTSEVSKIIKIIRTDIGRHIGDLKSNLNYKYLVPDIKEVLDTLITKEFEVRSDERKTYNIRMIPYRTVDNVIDGVVITFVDITQLESLRRLATVVMDSNDAITVLDPKGNIKAWNKAAERLYGWTETEALEMNIREVIPQGERGNTIQLIKDIFKGNDIQPFKTQRISKEGVMIDVAVTATKLVDNKGQITGISTIERKI